MFKNKTILITGSNGILGGEIVNYFNKFNCNLILTDRKGNSRKQTLKKKFYTCDLSKEKEIILFCKKIKKKYKKIDLIINNAAFVGDSKISGWNTKFDKQSYETFNSCLKVNLTSIFLLTKELRKLLNNSNNPSIVNISSIYSFLAPDYNLYKGTNIFNPAGYGSSKAALVYLTKWLAATLAPKIRCNSISLGGVERQQSKKFIKKYKDKVPLKRMANSKDLINSIIFL